MTRYGQHKVGWQALRTNALAVLAARLLVPACNIALVVIIARGGGAGILGQYTLLVTLFLLFENLKSLGLTTLLVRQVSQNHVVGLAQYRSLIRIGIAGAVIAAPLMCLVAAFSASASTALLPAAALMSIGLIPSAYAMAGDALFLALNRARLTLGVTLAENLLRSCISLAALRIWRGGVFDLVAVYVASRFFAVLAQKYLIVHYLRLRLPAYDWQITVDMLRRAPAFVTVFVSPLVLFRMDVVLLGVLAGDYQVGVYSAAARLISLSLIVPDSIMTASFVQLSRLARADEQSPFQFLVDRTFELVTGTLTLITVTGALLAPVLIRLLYGPGFEEAVPVMQTLLWALALFGASRALGDALVARGRQNSVARIVLTTIGASAGLYLWLIRAHSVNGAAWAFVASAAILCGLTLRQGLQRKVVGRVTMWRALLPLTACFAAFQITRFGASVRVMFALVCITAVVSITPVAWVLWSFWRDSRRPFAQGIAIESPVLTVQEEIA